MIADELAKAASLMWALAQDSGLHAQIAAAGEICAESVRAGGKILFVGNGGSAADSQHLAAELIVRLKADRPSIAALALTVDSSILTAHANDFGYDTVFARQIEGLGKPGDVLYAISTSGNSPSILLAMAAARQKGMKILGMSGQSGGKMAEPGMCDILFRMPSPETPHIQEGHIAVGHLICTVVENSLFNA
jgi:D-sedoheptulose 7-phosphate isomerase